MIPLGQTDLKVSAFCLGTMTWGNENTPEEAFAQADLAVDHGVNFFDTAEMYPVNPVRAETVGRSEHILGDWMAARGNRAKLVVATKLTGPSLHLREARPFDGAIMREAVDASLARLKTDYIDLYQIHWPNRGSYHFRQNWSYAPKGIDKAHELAVMDEILETAGDLIAAGKIRAIGLSNETVWGATRWRALAEAKGLPLMATIQNEYSLLCRQFDTDWAEFSCIENVPLLAYSTLAAGLLSGKYAGDVTPENSRRALVPNLGGRITPRVFPTVAAYLGLAARHKLNPVQMAIAFTRSRPFTCVPILGATKLADLETCLGAKDLVLSAEVLADIAEVYSMHPKPF